MLSGINQTSQMASLLFSKLDTRNQGYIEKSDLATAFGQLTSNGSSDSSVDNVFATLDSDSDGKVTESELSSVLSQLQQQLDGEFNRMRMQGGGHGGPQGMGGMPPAPPPPPADDAGFSEEELTAQLEEIGDSDSTRSELLNKIVDNFEAADSDGDGKVSFAEAMAYEHSTQDTAAGESSASRASSNEAQVMRQIMALLHAYGGAQDGEALASQLSVTA